MKRHVAYSDPNSFCFTSIIIRIVDMHLRRCQSLKNTSLTVSTNYIFIVVSRTAHVQCERREKYLKLFICFHKLIHFSKRIKKCFFFFILLLRLCGHFCLRIGQINRLLLMITAYADIICRKQKGIWPCYQWLASSRVSHTFVTLFTLNFAPGKNYPSRRMKTCNMCIL